MLKKLVVLVALLVSCSGCFAFESQEAKAIKAAKIVTALQENKFSDLQDIKIRKMLYENLGSDLAGNATLQKEMSKYAKLDELSGIKTKQTSLNETKAPIIMRNNIPVPTDKLVLIYKCDKNILKCQNSEENIQAGKVEFENELRNHYSNRIIVEDIIYDDNQQLESFEDFKAMLKPGQRAVILKINLEGQGETYREYQNVFGAKVGGFLPTTRIHVSEAYIDPANKGIFARDYGIKDYSPQSYAMSGKVYSSQTDPRKQVKNNVRGCIRDLCKFYGNEINKYSDPQKYNIEVNRFLCRFGSQILN